MRIYYGPEIDQNLGSGGGTAVISLPLPPEPPLTKERILALIQADEIYRIHANKLKGITHQEVADLIIEKKGLKELGLSLRYLNFTDLSQETAFAIMEINNGELVGEVFMDLNQFKVNYSEVFLKAIECGKPDKVAKELKSMSQSEAERRYPEKFNPSLVIEKEVALKLIDAGFAESVTKSFNIINRQDRDNIRLYAIKKGDTKAVVDHNLNDYHMSVEVLQALVQAGHAQDLARDPHQLMKNFDLKDGGSEIMAKGLERVYGVAEKE